MREHKKEIKSRGEIEEVLNRATTLHLGMTDGDEPYVVPVNFGFRDGYIYVHSSTEGKKIEILKRNSRVSFAVETDVEVVPPKETNIACFFGMRYRSVIGFGTAHLIEDTTEKIEGLKAIISHYSPQGHVIKDFADIEDYELSDEIVKITTIIKIKIDSMTGKRDRIE